MESFDAAWGVDLEPGMDVARGPWRTNRLQVAKDWRPEDEWVSGSQVRTPYPQHTN